MGKGARKKRKERKERKLNEKRERKSRYPQGDGGRSWLADHEQNSSRRQVGVVRRGGGLFGYNEPVYEEDFSWARSVTSRKERREYHSAPNANYDGSKAGYDAIDESGMMSQETRDILRSSRVVEGNLNPLDAITSKKIGQK